MRPISFPTTVAIPELNATPGAWVYIDPTDPEIPIVVVHGIEWSKAEQFIRQYQSHQKIAAALGSGRTRPVSAVAAPRLEVIR